MGLRQQAQDLKIIDFPYMFEMTYTRLFTGIKIFTEEH